MALNDMLKALEVDGKQQQSDIMETARVQARDIIKSAEAQAGDIKTAHVEQTQQDDSQETTKLLSEAKTVVERELNRTKDDVIEEMYRQGARKNARCVLLKRLPCYL